MLEMCDVLGFCFFFVFFFVFFVVFFFNDTATTEIYTLSLHDALPISIESEKILHLIRNINPNKAAGSDGISGQMLLLCDKSVVLP